MYKRQVVGGHCHRPRQGGADGCACGDCQIHTGVSPPLPGDGVDAVAELRGDHISPVLPDRRAEPIRTNKGNIGTNKSAAAAGVAIPEQTVDAVGIGLLLWCHFASGDSTDIFIDLHEVCDRHSNGIGLLGFRGGPVFIFGSDRPGPFLIGDKAVGEFLERACTEPECEYPRL